jgi:phosphate transport system substrate-binding protein
MKLKTIATLTIAVSIAATSLFASELQGRGASFPGPLYKAWISEYNAKTGEKINYTPTGSGDGIKSVKKRMVDFAGSDKPLKPNKLRKNKLYMFPTVVGSIVLAYNIPGIKDGDLKLSEKAIAGIFSGKIAYWDDKEITSVNSGLKLPHEKITVAVRADKSGTTYNFTYYLSKLDNKVFKASKKPNWKGNVVAGKSNAGVSANIEQTKYSIGYIEYSYKQKLGLSAAQVQNKEGEYILPTLKSFQNAAKYAKWIPDNDFYALIAYPDGKRSYPIVAATFILLPEEKTDTNKKVTKFFDFTYQNGDTIATDLGYVPLPKETKDMIRKYWADKGIN